MGCEPAASPLVYRAMNAIDVSRLNGANVLVSSDQDHRNPPTGVRGTLRVLNGNVVQVELGFPQMFTSRAHTRVVTLSDEQVSRMLGSEHDGAFAVTLRGRLDPAGDPGNE